MRSYNADTFIILYQNDLRSSVINQPAGLFANNYIEIENATEYNLQAANNKEVDWEEVGIKKNWMIILWKLLQLENIQLEML